IAKVTSKGQVTIPKSVRDDLELQPGSKLLFIKRGDSWRVVSPDRALTPLHSESETSDQIKQQFLAEMSAKYNLEYPIQTDQSKPIGDLLDEIRDAFQGVAEEQGWETEQDVADYTRAMRELDEN